MKCIDLITTFIADYVDGSLPPETRAEFERHLEGCSSCRAYLRTYRETIAMAAAAGAGPRIEVQDVPEDLIKAILEVRPS